jgi:hypothetical protein
MPVLCTIAGTCAKPQPSTYPKKNRPRCTSLGRQGYPRQASAERNLRVGAHAHQSFSGAIWWDCAELFPLL